MRSLIFLLIFAGAIVFFCVRYVHLTIGRGAELKNKAFKYTFGTAGWYLLGFLLWYSSDNHLQTKKIYPSGVSHILNYEESKISIIISLLMLPAMTIGMNFALRRKYQKLKNIEVHIFSLIIAFMVFFGLIIVDCVRLLMTDIFS